MKKYELILFGILLPVSAVAEQRVCNLPNLQRFLPPQNVQSFVPMSPDSLSFPSFNYLITTNFSKRQANYKQCQAQLLESLLAKTLLFLLDILQLEFQGKIAKLRTNQESSVANQALAQAIQKLKDPYKAIKKQLKPMKFQELILLSNAFSYIEISGKRYFDSFTDKTQLNAGNMADQLQQVYNAVYKKLQSLMKDISPKPNMNNYPVTLHDFVSNSSKAIRGMVSGIPR